MKKHLDAGDEVGELRKAVDAARILVEMLLNHSAPDAETAREVPRCEVAVLNLTSGRMRDVQRALKGTLDPVKLVTQSNESIGAADGAVQLRPWTPERLKQEVERLVRRERHEEKQRRRRR